MIPIIALSIPVVAIWTKHQQKMAEMQIDSAAQHTDERSLQYTHRVRELEDRVKVLERIVTDKGYDVAHQIEALREVRMADEAIGKTKAEQVR
jgi:hypothetical protein